MDERSRLEKWLDRWVGEPLYYCTTCRRPVHVSNDAVVRKCAHADSPICAPRKVMVSLSGHLSWRNRLKLKYWQMGSRLTSRNI